MSLQGHLFILIFYILFSFLGYFLNRDWVKTYEPYLALVIGVGLWLVFEAFLWLGYFVT